MAEATTHTTGEGGEPSRRDFIYIAAGAAGAVGAAATVWPFVAQMNPAADTLALASTEYDVSAVAEGQQVVIMWRGKPVFVRHRTADEIARAKADDAAVPSMRDPATDAERIAQANGEPGKEGFLIVQANCPHLGCVPNFKEGEYGGWFCPCHGSVFDTAGRIRGGPSPRNLDKAPYVYTSDTVIRIG